MKANGNIFLFNFFVFVIIIYFVLINRFLNIFVSSFMLLVNILLIFTG